MPPIDLREIFHAAASEVLETMFFTEVEGENTAEPPEQLVSSELEFKGAQSGSFGIQVSLETGKEFAANFLGLDEVRDAQVGEVICELCNMLCGSVLSRVEAGARFELSHPIIDARNVQWHERADAIGYTFGLGEGVITLWLVLHEQSQMSPAA